MYPLCYPPLTGKAVVPLDHLPPSDSSSTHQPPASYPATAFRRSGNVFAKGTRDQIGDVLPYKETRPNDFGNPEGREDSVDVLLIPQDAHESLEVHPYTVANLVDLVAGKASNPTNGGKPISEKHRDLHAAIVFIKKGQLKADCIHRLAHSFNPLPQFWDKYGTASVINSESTMTTELREIPTNDITLHLSQPVGTVMEAKQIKARKRRHPSDSEIHFHFNTPSFFIKWQRSDAAHKQPNSAAAEVLLLCLLSPETNYEDLRNTLSQAYSDPTSRAVLRDDPYGLIGVVMIQWLTWSQELFYQLEQLVLGIESDLDDDPAFSTSAKTRAKVVNFSEMHRIAKHIIQYLDTLQVTAQLQDSVTRCHEKLWKARLLDADNSPAFQSVKDALQYCALVSIGVKSRVEGLKSRMDNQIALGYNLVQQRDAQLAQSTSNSMYSLSLVTFAFLPLTAVASVLAMPYFSVHDADLTWVGSGFTLAWAIGTALLLALAVSLLWCACVYRGSVLRLWRRRVMVAEDGENVV